MFIASLFVITKTWKQPVSTDGWMDKKMFYGHVYTHKLMYTNIWILWNNIVSDSLWPHGLQSMEFSRPEYWSGWLSFLQGIFPTQGLNPGLPHCGRILYQLSHKGSPTILEWIVYLFSRGSSQPRYQTRVSYIAGGFFINWAIREAQVIIFRHKREENPAICNSVYGPWKHYAK